MRLFPQLQNVIKTISNHQVEGICTIVDSYNNEARKGMLLADAMGLGKTCEAVIIIYMMCMQHKSKAIVVCPKALIGNWESEFKKWIGIGLCTTKNIGFFLYLPESLVLIISYEQLICLEKHALYNFLNDSKVILKVFDEAHVHLLAGIKISKTPQKSTPIPISAKNLHGKHVLLMTGTPFLNKNLDIKRWLDVVHPHWRPDSDDDHDGDDDEILDDLSEVAISDKTFMNKYPKNSLPACHSLNRLLNPFMVRRGQNILNLPPRQINAIFFEKLSESQEMQYANLFDVGSQDQKFSNAHRSKAQRICNVCDDITLSSNAADILAKSTKLQFLLDAILYFQALSTSTGMPMQKIVVCSHFTEIFLSIFEIVLKFYKIGYVTISGSESSSVDAVVSTFNLNPFVNVMLLSSKKGGCGLTLVSSQIIFMVDLDWSPMNDKQAMARIFRIGQKLPSFVFMLLAHAKLDDSIFQVQEIKNVCSSIVLGDQNQLIECYSNEQIKMTTSTTNRQHVRPKPTSLIGEHTFWKPWQAGPDSESTFQVGDKMITELQTSTLQSFKVLTLTCPYT